jgi:hemerythrin-like metal-binding protein
MADLIWNEQMSVGVQAMDDDHKELVVLMNELHEVVVSGQSRNALNDVIDRIMKSAKAHFGKEEDLLFKAGFPGADAHHSEHEQMLKTGLEWQAYFKDVSSPAMSLEAMSGFQSWLDNHIQGADMLYGQHLNAKGIY